MIETLGKHAKTAAFELAKYATLFHFYRAASANASTSHFSPHTVEIASIAGFFRLYGIIKACGVFNVA